MKMKVIYISVVKNKIAKKNVFQNSEIISTNQIKNYVR